MGIFSRKQKDIQVEKRSEEWVNPITGTINLQNINTYSTSKALKLSTVYRCINLISESVASLPLIPYTYKDPITGKLTNWKYINYTDSYYNLLNIQPNSIIGANTFKKLIVQNMILKGNAYILIDRDKTGKVLNLTLLVSDHITPKVENGDLVYYDTVYKRTYDKSQIIHIVNYSQDGVNGVSTLTNASITLGISYNSEEHTSNFFKGGASLAGILRPTAGTNINREKAQSAKNNFISALDSTLNGTSNSIVVLDSSLEYQPLTISPKDAQLIESRQFNVQDVCRFFAVPPSMAFSESGKFSTAEQQQVDFLNNCITPLIEKIENEFFRKLYLPSQWEYSELKFDVENLMRTDATTRADYYTKLFRVGGYTTNEIREKLNAGFPVTGGNRSFIEINLQPTDALIAETGSDKQIDNKLKE